MFGIFWSNHSREFIEFCNAAFANAFTTMIKDYWKRSFLYVCIYIKILIYIHQLIKNCHQVFVIACLKLIIYIYIEDDNC
jgi:hypothetical protein